MSYPYLIEPMPVQLKAQKTIYRQKSVHIVGEVGCGKTKIGVDFIGNMVWANKVKRALIICPNNALGVWETSLDDNCPFLKYSFFTSDNREPDWDANVIIINYDFLSPRRREKLIRGEKRPYINWVICELLIAWDPEIVVTDEGHKIKNPNSRRAKACHKLGAVAEYKINLTGTPSGNKSIIDWWSQFKFIKADLLSEKFKQHKRRFGVYGGWGGLKFLKAKNEKVFARLVAPYTIYIKTEDLPPENYVEYPIVLPPRAKQLYKQMEEEFLASMEDEKKIVASIALAKAVKLSQIAGGFILDKEKNAYPIHTAKLDAVREIQESLQESEVKRLVVFAHFVWELDHIKSLLEEAGWWVHRVSGKVTKQTLAHFDNEGGVMLCQIASGSDANNFQSSHHTIFYSWDDSLINWIQAKGRTRRKGQTQKTTYHILLAKGTVDVNKYRRLRNNVEIASDVIKLVQEIRNDHSRRG